MPSGPRREDHILRVFLSAYEDCFWKDAEPEFPDKLPADGPEVPRVDALARKDGRTVAVEHTLIEPFLGERGDRALFEPAFEAVRQDAALSVQDRITDVYVPVGILAGHRRKAHAEIAGGIHAWLKQNVERLPEGWSEQPCTIRLTGRDPIETTLNVRVVPSPGFSNFIIARQQVTVDLDKVVARALAAKLPKLVETPADKRVLLLERQHMNSTPMQILDEVENLRPSVPALAQVDDIWVVETIAYEREGILFFERYDPSMNKTGEISYYEGRVKTRWEEGLDYPVVER